MWHTHTHTYIHTHADDSYKPTGVSQGSVCRPILFSLYVSPIAEIASSYNLAQQQYADDTQLYVEVTCLNLPFNIQQLEQCLADLHTLFYLNGLTLNPDKSETIIFGTRQSALTLPSLNNIDVASCKVPISSQVKILGVTLDSTLSLNRHVTTLSKACYLHIRALWYIRNALTDDSAKSIACTLIGSRLDYANALFISASASNITKLQQIQNTLARIVTCQRGWTGTSQSLATLHWLPVKWRVDFKVATISYKLFSTGQPSNLANSISKYVPSRSLRSTGEGTLSVPRTKTVIGAHAFWSAAPFIWNRLPYDIRNSSYIPQQT